MAIDNTASLLSARPWYRHVWPWIIFGIPGASVVAGVSLLLVAVRSNDGLVTDDYYKQGLTINRTLSRGDLARSMDLRATLQPTSRGLQIVLGAREGIAVPQNLRLTLAHPTRSGMDRHIEMQAGAAGFAADLADLTVGRWNLILEDEAQSWRLTGSITWPLSAPLVLDASQ